MKTNKQNERNEIKEAYLALGRDESDERSHSSSIEDLFICLQIR
jgi:hypothetical protein